MTAKPDEPRPDANTRPCADCGHVWFAGERKHVYVDSSTGDDDEVICVLCQRVRERPARNADW